MITLEQFISMYQNQHNVGDTPENKGQCVGLVEMWIDNLQFPHIWGNAKDLFANADGNFFEKIANTLTNVPLPGDIIVWDEKEGSGAGHTAIVHAADVYHFMSFDQNWRGQNNPSGACEIVRHDYANLIGWLHPKEQLKTCEEQLVDANKLKDEFYNNWQTALHKISDLEQQIKQLQNQLNTPVHIISPASALSPLDNSHVPPTQSLLSFIHSQISSLFNSYEPA